MRKSFICLITLAVLLALGGTAWWFFARSSRPKVSVAESLVSNIQQPLATQSLEQQVIQDASLTSDTAPNRDGSSMKVIHTEPPPLSLVHQEVPFTVQAPRGRWSQSMFQDACEEASALMAASWAQGKGKLTPNEAEKQIRLMTKWEEKRFGVAVDLSPQDAGALLSEYFQWPSVSVVDNPSKRDLIATLFSGAVVIVPTNGKALHNPFYTAGGPDRHMLVIIGYDQEKKQFITNDPGTKHGAGYRYDEEVLSGAIRAYMTGDHKPIEGVRKAMIVVRR
jgi:hypothetical protein